jgi:hypothetical protein
MIEPKRAEFHQATYRPWVLLCDFCAFCVLLLSWLLWRGGEDGEVGAEGAEFGCARYA